MQPFTDRRHTFITTALTFYDDDRGLDHWLDVLMENLTMANMPDQCDQCAAAGDCSPRFPFIRGKGDGVWRYVCYRCAYQWQCSWASDDVLPIKIWRNRSMAVAK